MPWINHKGEVCSPNDGVEYSPETPVEELHKAERIIIHFSNFGDGRPFSWCSKLRKSGYKGEIAASGELGVDRIFYAFRCGFNHVWVTDEELPLVSSLHLQPFDNAYQPAEGDSDIFTPNK